MPNDERPRITVGFAMSTDGHFVIATNTLAVGLLRDWERVTFTRRIEGGLHAEVVVDGTQQATVTDQDAIRDQIGDIVYVVLMHALHLYPEDIAWITMADGVMLVARTADGSDRFTELFINELLTLLDHIFLVGALLADGLPEGAKRELINLTHSVSTMKSMPPLPEPVTA